MVNTSLSCGVADMAAGATTARRSKLGYEPAVREGVGLMFGLLLMAFGSSSLGHSQEIAASTVVGHQPASCMDTETFPLIEAQTVSPDAARDVRGLSVRFRAEDAPGWHEVAMESESDTRFLAALPRPRPEAVRVHYYFAWGRPEVRSPEFVVNILRGGCPSARNAPTELTEGIRVRRTSNAQDEIPRGFSPDGIARGPSPRLALGIVAGGAAGAGVAAIIIAGDESMGPAVPEVDPEAPRACFLPDPVPNIDSGDTLRFDASCTTPATVMSFEWTFGDGTSARGSSVEHLFTPAGTYTVTLTVSDRQRMDNISRFVRVLATPTACVVTAPNPPRISLGESIDFDAACSAGDRDGGPSEITTYEWDFGDGRPGREGVFVSRLFVRPDLYGVTLTVTNGDGRRDQTTQFVVVEDSSSVNPGDVTFTSQLELPEGNSGQISLNATEIVATVAPAPQRYRLRAYAQENVVDARLLTRPNGPGRWQFDFSNSQGFVPGSLRVDSGQVLSLDNRRVVFRVGEGAGPPIRFRFRLED